MFEWLSVLLFTAESDQLHHRRRAFENEIERVLANGTISPAEGDRIKELHERLGLTDHQAAEIMRLMLSRRGHGHCPHCGKPLAALSDPG